MERGWSVVASSCLSMPSGRPCGECGDGLDLAPHHRREPSSSTLVRLSSRPWSSRSNCRKQPSPAPGPQKQGWCTLDDGAAKMPALHVNCTRITVASATVPSLAEMV